jgi:hypothetical protein
VAVVESSTPRHNIGVDHRNRSSRRKSIDEFGHAHEFTFSIYKRFPFLRSNQPCQWLAEAIDKARAELDFQL